jgi:hypothetical protein
VITYCRDWLAPDEVTRRIVKAPMKGFPILLDVRIGSIASAWPRTDDFRSTPINRHRCRASGCLKCAMSGQKSPVANGC